MNLLAGILVPSPAIPRNAATATVPPPRAGARTLAGFTRLLVSEEEGASLVEFALVASMLLFPLVILAAVFPGWMIVTALSTMPTPGSIPTTPEPPSSRSWPTWSRRARPNAT